MILNLQTKATAMQRKINPKEIIITACILILGIILFLLYNKSDSKEKTAVITFNSEVIKELPLNENQVLKINDISFQIKDNSIAVINSDCPDKICIKTGYISNTGESIVCMPNRLIVTIKG